MNLFDFIKKQSEKPDKEQKNEEVVLSEVQMNIPEGAEGFGSHFTVPWDTNGPWAMEKDFDQDGIPDALDHKLGQGALPEKDYSVPWDTDSPWAVEKDFDQDGIPDALDHNLGQGAYLEKDYTVPWDTNSPWAMEKDFDHDGIPDALDRHLGQGADDDYYEE